MKIATTEKMREIDQAAVNQYGIQHIVLMENAGAETAKAAVHMLGDPQGKKVSIFAGTGNNGGDAFVAARHLYNCGGKVKVYILGDAEKLQGSAKVNLEILQNMDFDLTEVSSERDWDKVKIALAFSDLLIDGLLGTGFSGEPRADMVRMIRMINGAEKPVLAIDLPSGVTADAGKVVSTAVRAVRTISFGLPKLGLLLYPGALFAGAVTVVNIGLPRELLTDARIAQNLLDDAQVKPLLIKRPPDVHKGHCGKVLIVAGSNGMTGAAVLAAQAALRAGAGVVTLAIAASLQDIAAAKLTEVMTCALPEIAKGVIGDSALPVLLELSRDFDVVEIGSGLGRAPETQQLIRDFIRETDRQLIIDADALNACQAAQEDLAQVKIMPILTPHFGEMARLMHCPIQEVEENSLALAREAAAAWNVIVVLKSARTIVAYPDGNVYINIRGNAGMATAGSGDVLAGVISGLFAQGLLNYSAALVGVYLHAAAGDLAAESGMIGLTAGDIAALLPAARLRI